MGAFGRSARLVAAWLVPLIVLAAPLAAPADHREDERWVPPGPFCESTTVRGDPGELDALPPLRGVPESGHLPFGPEALVVHRSPEMEAGLPPGADQPSREVGITLGVIDDPRQQLGWRVSLKLSPVDRAGRTTGPERGIRRRIGSIARYGSVPLYFPLRRPGLYRVNVAFETTAGDPLGSYGFYHRLLPPIAAPPRLAINRGTLSPGEVLSARVENMSPESVFYGVAYRVDRWDGSSWATAPESPSGPWIMIGLRSFPGGTGRCNVFRVPESMPAGDYRIVKGIGPSLGRSTTMIDAVFAVRPSTAAGPRTTRRGS